MKIKTLKLNKFYETLDQEAKNFEKQRVSFFFDDGDNWHFELSKDASKEELLSALRGMCELIVKTIN